MASQITYLTCQMLWTCLLLAFTVDAKDSIVTAVNPLVSFGSGDGPGIPQSLSALEAAYDQKIVTSVGPWVSFGRGDGPGLSQRESDETSSHPLTVSPVTLFSPLDRFGAGGGPGVPEAKVPAGTQSATNAEANHQVQTFSVLQLEEAKVDTIPGISNVVANSISASSKLKSFRGVVAASRDSATSAPAFTSSAGEQGRAGYAALLEIREIQLALLLIVAVLAACSAKVLGPRLQTSQPTSPPREDPLGYLFKVGQLDCQRPPYPSMY